MSYKVATDGKKIAGGLTG